MAHTPPDSSLLVHVKALFKTGCVDCVQSVSIEEFTAIENSLLVKLAGEIG
uniref:Uncharacterized protein n=1 Tax=Arion vulgaris TaxID=1028688 RepID=A0A0B7AX71_9EUPU